MAIELVDFEELKVMLGLSASKSESDYPDLTLIQESVVNMFESFTGRFFTEDKYIEQKFIGCSKTKMIPLKGVPIKSISSVTIDGVLTPDYKIKGYGIELSFPVTDVEIEVVYTGGITEVIGSLHRAALLQTVYEYQNKDSIGIQTTSTNGGTVTKPELGMLKEVAKLLAPLKHPFPVF